MLFEVLGDLALSWDPGENLATNWEQIAKNLATSPWRNLATLVQEFQPVH